MKLTELKIGNKYLLNEEIIVTAISYEPLTRMVGLLEGGLVSIEALTIIK